ncbi:MULTISPECIES: cobalt-precorrin-7 (C(5))-methyltransferase [Hafnia]|uniref:Cobalt-precorrin-7 (C(5))-methyltransferase n=1 Tax=Hafnia paralvei TaxID=546367 RepID=A0A4Q9EJ52_9GAMM|nr:MULTISPECIES: cobalt-precorrin-7 (C(5))-methyltransferase [Hafnia]OFS12740.1 cobalt-precorrin-6Y C(5)-methyltransferase [Hafnia sp. HMSC23F03]TBM24641.1 cobalt-precorrin-7 (C(5))-methyltransferase [Hafnia paralvei]
MIHIVGMGPGDQDYITPLALRLIAQADVLVGWPRHLASCADFQGEKRSIGTDLAKAAAWLQCNADRNIVVLASGDPMLFGIGKRLSQDLEPAKIRIVPGISSIQYLFSQIAIDMNDIYITSSHGKKPDFNFILQHDKVAMVTDLHIGPYQIAQEILLRGQKRTLVIGENLTYPDECIHILPPEKVQQAYAMNVVVILNER